MKINEIAVEKMNIVPDATLSSDFSIFYILRDFDCPHGVLRRVRAGPEKLTIKFTWPKEAF